MLLEKFLGASGSQPPYRSGPDSTQDSLLPWRGTSGRGGRSWEDRTAEHGRFPADTMMVALDQAEEGPPALIISLVAPGTRDPAAEKESPVSSV